MSMPTSRDRCARVRCTRLPGTELVLARILKHASAPSGGWPGNAAGMQDKFAAQFTRGRRRNAHLRPQPVAIPHRQHPSHTFIWHSRSHRSALPQYLPVLSCTEIPAPRCSRPSDAGQTALRWARVLGAGPEAGDELRHATFPCIARSAPPSINARFRHSASRRHQRLSYRRRRNDVLTHARASMQAAPGHRSRPRLVLSGKADVAEAVE
jgi:hypothetical protein